MERGAHIHIAVQMAVLLCDDITQVGASTVQVFPFLLRDGLSIDDGPLSDVFDKEYHSPGGATRGCGFHHGRNTPGGAVNDEKFYRCFVSGLALDRNEPLVPLVGRKLRIEERDPILLEKRDRSHLTPGAFSTSSTEEYLICWWRLVLVVHVVCRARVIRCIGGVQEHVADRWS